MKITATLGFLGIMLGSAAAFADSDAVVFSGNATSADAKIAMTAASIRLRAAKWQIVDSGPALTQKETAALLQCLASTEPQGCVNALVRPKKLRRVAVLALSDERNPDGSVLRVVTVSLAYTDGKTFQVDRGFCDHCVADAMTSTTTTLVSELLNRAALASELTALKVSSTPTGAGVVVDNEPAGATNSTMYIAPGPHTVELTLDGYKSEVRKIEGIEGQTAEVSIVLQKQASGTVGSVAFPTTLQPTVDAHGGTPALAYAAMGFGGAAILGGGVLLLMNEPAVDAPRTQDQPRVYRETIIPGVALIAGGAMVGVGGYIWWRRTKSTTAPVMALTPGGAITGVSGTF
jgi:PEGA domain